VKYCGPTTAVLLADNPDWLDALEESLMMVGITAVALCHQPTHAFAALVRLSPELLVADLETRDSQFDGFTCLQEACARLSQLKAVAVSPSGDQGLINSAFLAGAAAFIVKSAAPKEVATAVRQLFQPVVFLAPPDSWPVAVPRRLGTLHGSFGLTRKEFEILRLVAEGSTNSQTAGRLWVSKQTVKFHLTKIYSKLGVSNRTEASQWAHEHGLLTTPDRLTVNRHARDAA
jgi:DNA-binding NarL/FixJ family response regulator